MSNAVIGIDIGGTNTVIGLVSHEGEILAQKHLVTAARPNFDDYISDIAGEVAALTSENPSVSILGIGVGAPDGNYLTGAIEHAANLLWKGIVPVVEKLSKATLLPVRLTNDANAAAVGEHLFGGAKGLKNFIVVTLGTGLGGGVYTRGELLYGHSGHAGELGHVNLYPGGRVCGCGARGCIETYVSATGIVRTAIEIMSEYLSPSVLREKPLKNLSSKDVYDAALGGDFVAEEAFKRTSEHLGKALSEITTVLSPEKIFLFGGLAKAGDYLLTPARAAFEKNLMPMFQGHTSIEISSLPEGDAAVLGSAAVMWEAVDQDTVKGSSL